MLAEFLFMCASRQDSLGFSTVQCLGPKSNHPKEKEAEAATLLKTEPETNIVLLLPHSIGQAITGPRFKGMGRKPHLCMEQYQNFWGAIL